MKPYHEAVAPEQPGNPGDGDGDDSVVIVVIVIVVVLLIICAGWWYMRRKKQQAESYVQDRVESLQYR